MAQLAAERHEKRGQRLMGRKPNGQFNNTGEAEVVPGHQLAAVLQEWERGWLAERNWELEKSYEMDDELGIPMQKQGKVLTPTQFLMEHTGLSDRRLRGFRNGHFPVVSLTQAESVLRAIGREYLLGWHVQVIPNPNWDTESWVEYMREKGCV
jgi:hypothetical protein